MVDTPTITPDMLAASKARAKSLGTKTISAKELGPRATTQISEYLDQRVDLLRKSNDNPNHSPLETALTRGRIIEALALRSLLDPKVVTSEINQNELGVDLMDQHVDRALAQYEEGEDRNLRSGGNYIDN